MTDFDEWPTKETIDYLRKRNRRRWDYIVTSIFVFIFAWIAVKFYDAFGVVPISLTRISELTRIDFPSNSQLIHSIKCGRHWEILAEIEMDRQDAEQLMQKIQAQPKRLDGKQIGYVRNNCPTPKWWNTETIVSYKCALHDAMRFDLCSGFQIWLFLKPGNSKRAMVYLWYPTR